MNNNFIKINNDLTFCVRGDHYHGLYIEPSMVIVNKCIAKKAFDDLEAIEDDLIIKHQRGGESFIGFVKLNNEWQEVDLTMNHRGYVDTYNLLCDLDTYGERIISLTNIIGETSDFYTGDSFSVSYDYNDHWDYDDFLKTDIEGVYERPIYSYGVSEFDVITNSEFNALKGKYEVAPITEKSRQKNVMDVIKKIISRKVEGIDGKEN